MEQTALFTDPVTVFGILFATIGIIFKTSVLENSFFTKLYKFFPPLLLCYFVPSILVNWGIIADPNHMLYWVASRYLLPACIILLTLSVDIKGILELGPKVIIMFLTATISIIVGGAVSLLAIINFFPSLIPSLGVDALWRGMTTIAGTWIGGAANQTAMKEIYQVPDAIFSTMVTVDVLCASIWLAIIFWIAGNAKKVDNFLNADTSALDELKHKLDHFQQENRKIPSTTNYMILGGLAFGLVALSHFLGGKVANYIKTDLPDLHYLGLTSHFFWTIIIATTISILISFKKEVRKLEGMGASRIGTVFLYVLVATIGMTMELRAIWENIGLFIIGAIWMSFHAIVIFLVAKLIRAPSFYLCVASTANIGGAATSPVVASAFHPSLAPVGVLLAMFGYALGTYGAWLCGQIMRVISGT